MGIYWIIIASVIAVDQITKWLTVFFLKVGESFALLPNVFHFTYVQNEGAAMGMLQNHRWVFMLFSTVAIVAILLYLWKNHAQSRFASVALSLVVGGGIGNMIDRVRLGYVIDMLDFCAFDFWVWVFNVADSCVCVGGGMLVAWCVVMIVREEKNKKQPRSDAVEAEPPSDGEDEEMRK